MSDSRVLEIIRSWLATPSVLGFHVTPGIVSVPYSPLRKKKSLFLIMGPPMRPPTLSELLEFAPTTSFPSTVFPVNDSGRIYVSVSYTHLRAHETRHDLVCRLLLEKKKK